MEHDPFLVIDPLKHGAFPYETVRLPEGMP